MSSSASVATSPEELLAQLRGQLAQGLERAKVNIESNLGTVVTDVNQKVNMVDATLLELKAAGQKIMEDVDRQNGEPATRNQAVIGDATSEFGKHRNAIGQVAT